VSEEPKSTGKNACATKGKERRNNAGERPDWRRQAGASVVSRKYHAKVQSLQGRFAPWAEAQGLPSPIDSRGVTPGLKPRPP